MLVFYINYDKSFLIFQRKLDLLTHLCRLSEFFTPQLFTLPISYPAFVYQNAKYGNKCEIKKKTKILQNNPLAQISRANASLCKFYKLLSINLSSSFNLFLAWQINFFSSIVFLPKSTSLRTLAAVIFGLFLYESESYIHFSSRL